MSSKKPPKRAAAKKPAAKKKGAAAAAEKPMPPLVTPKHGRGKLYRGGVPGNRGGQHGGPPPSKLRSQLRADFEARREQLLGIIDGDVTLRIRGTCEKCGHEHPTELSIDEIKSALPGVSDRLKAFDILLRYGLGKAEGLDRQEFEEIALDLGEAVQTRVRARLANDVAGPLLEQIFDDWRRIVIARRLVSGG